MQSNANLIMSRPQESPITKPRGQNDDRSRQYKPYENNTYGYSYNSDTGSSYGRNTGGGSKDVDRSKNYMDQGYNSSASVTSYERQGTKEDGQNHRMTQRLAGIREKHGQSPIQKASEKQFLASNSSNDRKYGSSRSYDPHEAIDKFIRADDNGHSSNLDNIQINSNLPARRRTRLGRPEPDAEPQKYRLQSDLNDDPVR